MKREIQNTRVTITMNTRIRIRITELITKNESQYAKTQDNYCLKKKECILGRGTKIRVEPTIEKRVDNEKRKVMSDMTNNKISRSRVSEK